MKHTAKSQVELFARAYGRYCATMLDSGWWYEKSFWFPEVRVDDDLAVRAEIEAVSRLRPLYQAAKASELSRLELDLALEIGRFHLLDRVQALYQHAVDQTARTGTAGRLLRDGSELGLVAVGTIVPWTRAARPFIAGAASTAGASATTYADTGDVGKTVGVATLTSAAEGVFRIPMSFARAKGASKYVVMVSSAVVDSFVEGATALIRVGDHRVALEEAFWGGVAATLPDQGKFGLAAGRKGFEWASSATIPVRTIPSPGLGGSVLLSMQRAHPDLKFPLQHPQEQARWIAETIRWNQLVKFGRAKEDEPFKVPVKLQSSQGASRRVNELWQRYRADVAKPAR